MPMYIELAMALVLGTVTIEGKNYKFSGHFDCWDTSPKVASPRALHFGTGISQAPSCEQNSNTTHLLH